jgi:hypothetical protein
MINLGNVPAGGVSLIENGTLQGVTEAFMSQTERPQSPFAGKLDFSARPSIRALSPDEIERQLAEHRLYLDTEWRQGHRAKFRLGRSDGARFLAAEPARDQDGPGPAQGRLSPAPGCSGRT